MNSLFSLFLLVIVVSMALPSASWSAGTKDGGGGYAYSWTSARHLRRAKNRILRELTRMNDTTFLHLTRGQFEDRPVTRAELIALFSGLESQYTPISDDDARDLTPFRVSAGRIIARQPYFQDPAFNSESPQSEAIYRIHSHLYEAAGRALQFPDLRNFAQTLAFVVDYSGSEPGLDDTCGTSGRVSERILDCDETWASEKTVWEVVMKEWADSDYRNTTLVRHRASGQVTVFLDKVRQEELKLGACKTFRTVAESPYEDWRAPTAAEAREILDRPGDRRWEPENPCVWIDTGQVACRDGHVGSPESRSFLNWLGGVPAPSYPLHCVAHKGTEQPARPVDGAEIPPYSPADPSPVEIAPPTASQIQRTLDYLARAERPLIRTLSALSTADFRHFTAQFPASAQIDRRVLIEAIRGIRLDASDRAQRLNNWGNLEPLLFNYDRSTLSLRAEAPLVQYLMDGPMLGSRVESLEWRILHEASHLFGIGISGNDLDSVLFARSLLATIQKYRMQWASGYDVSACGAEGDVKQKIADCDDESYGPWSLVSRPIVKGDTVWRDSRDGHLMIVTERAAPSLLNSEIEKICASFENQPGFEGRWRKPSIEEAREIWKSEIPSFKYGRQEEQCLWSGEDHQVTCVDGTVDTRYPRWTVIIGGIPDRYHVACVER